jgi:2-dehydropantoate 2-reductase
MRISILGLGALGRVFAASLAQTEHQVHLHVRGERGAHAMLEGLAVDGGPMNHVPADRFLFTCEELERPLSFDQRSDLVIFATKSYAIPSLLDVASSLLKPDGVALALSNGLGHPETLGRALGPHRVVAATTTHGAYMGAENTVVWAGKGAIQLARTPLGPSSERLEAIFTVFERAGLAPSMNEDAATMLWNKVLLNLAINPIAALAGLQNGELLAPDRFDTCMMVYREAVRVARMERITVPDEQEFEHALRAVLNTTAENQCSMLQDMKAGRKTEIDALNGALVDLAEAHGVSVPVNQLLATLIRACHP